jgi:hypothetical protein
MFRMDNDQIPRVHYGGVDVMATVGDPSFDGQLPVEIAQ